MKTITLQWPTRTAYSRKTVTLDADGVVLQFTVPADEKPRRGALGCVSPKGIGEASSMSMVLSDTPGGKALAKYATVKDSQSPSISFNVGKAVANRPKLDAGKTYYATVTPLGPPGDVVVDLNAYAPF